MNNQIQIIRRWTFFFLFFMLTGSIHAMEERDKQPVYDLLNQLKEANSRVSSFTAMMRLENHEEDLLLQRQRVWFKKPGYILIEQLGPYKEGSRLAITPDGKIKGHMGGFFSFAVASLSPDDENLFGVTKDSAFDTDFSKVIDKAYSLAQRMSRYQIDTIAEDGVNYIVLDTRYNDKINRYRMFIDPNKMLIARIERYTNKGLIHRINWTNVKLNIHIENSKFQL